jgi:Tfp pilus assembly protein PilF
MSLLMGRDSIIVVVTVITLGGCSDNLAPNLEACKAKATEALGQLDKGLDNFREALEIAPRLESAEEGFARITEQQKHSDRGK